VTLDCTKNKMKQLAVTQGLSREQNNEKKNMQLPINLDKDKNKINRHEGCKVRIKSL